MDDEPTGSISTNFSVIVGSSAAGNIEVEGDVDFFAVQLVAGVTYQIDLEGSRTGSGDLLDPFLTGVFNANGGRVASQDDDDGVSTNSRILFTPSVTGTYFIGASSFNNTSGTDVGTYTLYVEEEALSDRPDPNDLRLVADTGNDFVDVLVFGRAYGDGVNTPTVTFSLITNTSNFISPFLLDDVDVTQGARPVSSASEAAFRDGLVQVESYANINFLEVADTGNTFGTIRIFASTSQSGNTIGLAGLPSESPVASDIAIFENRINGDGKLGHVVLHELGHALGLTHADTSDTPFPVEFAGAEFTVMSPSFASAFFPTANGVSFYPTTFGYGDILALRQIYGPQATPDQDNVYQFNVDLEYWETIFDTGGNDTIEIVGGSESVKIDLSPDSSAFGGSFIDVGTTVQYFSGNRLVGTRDDTVFISPETIIENIIVAGGDDTVVGNDANNRIEGGDGADKIDGAAGSDRLLGEAGNDELAGGNGNDTLVGGTGNDAAAGGDGQDVLFAGAGDTGDDVFVGGRGGDIVGGGGGDDIVIGDSYFGTAFSFGVAQGSDNGSASDTLFGGAGNDTLLGGNLNDTNNNGRVDAGEADQSGSGGGVAFSGTGDDVIYAAAGDDIIGGGTGSDVIRAGAGDDTIYGGRGDQNDTGVNDEIFGEDGDDLIFASGGADRVTAGAGNDIVFGGSQNDIISGGLGNDEIFGGDGNDIVRGDNGDDTLRGGTGDDTLTGGNAADNFVFSSGDGGDRIEDFSVDQDTLVIKNTITDFTNVADVIAASSNIVIGGVSGILLDTGGTDSIFIVGLTVSDISSMTITLE